MQSTGVKRQILHRLHCHRAAPGSSALALHLHSCNVLLVYPTVCPQLSILKTSQQMRRPRKWPFLLLLRSVLSIGLSVWKVMSMPRSVLASTTTSSLILERDYYWA